ncbi:hypothetical protein SDC9_98556 [bioreactor metagenome]|uniref:Uncharacterized protein n=1 Tax=bioreactor metagenome TaxID=1076179 RepID=A0A645AF20_9ZZZZ
MRHGQRRQLVLHGRSQPCGGLLAQLGDVPTESQQCGIEIGDQRIQFAQPLVPATQVGQPHRCVRGPGEHVVDGRAVLARQPGQLRAP